MEVVQHIWISWFVCQNHLSPCLFVNKSLETLVNDVQSPREIEIERLMQKVHQVGLAHVSEGQNLLTGDARRTKLAKVYNGDPLVSEAWQKHYTF